MANREKGEASFETDGKTYTLRTDTTAWAYAQDALSKGANVPPMELVLARLTANHMLTILAMFYGALQKYHSRDIPDMRTATDLFEKSKGAGSDALTRALNLSAPDTEDLKELGVSENPPKAQGGKKTKVGVGDVSESKPVMLA